MVKTLYSILHRSLDLTKNSGEYKIFCVNEKIHTKKEGASVE